MLGSDSLSSLLLASYLGDDITIQKLLSFGADLNETDHHGVSPLWAASEQGHTHVVDLFLSSGADVNPVQTTTGATALLMACQNGYLEVVQSLVSSGADTNRPSDNLTFPLHIASVKGHYGIVKLLLSSGAKINALDHNGISPLWAACEQGHIDVVKVLLFSGADVNLVPTATEATALYMACQNGQLDVIQLLLKSGADPNMTIADGVSPLWFACSRRRIHVAQLLLSSGADVNSARASDGATALYMACQNGHLEVAQLLLSSGADSDRRCNDGTSPLFIAAHHGHYGIVQLLVSRGANINPSHSDVVSPLWLACAHGHIRVAQLLLSSGADVNSVQAQTGTTALCLACQDGHFEMVKLLLSAGADLNLSTHDDASPLWVACGEGHAHVVQLLLSAGADVNSVRTTDGATALCMACQNGHLGVVQLILSSGADVNELASNCISPLWIACQDESIEIVKLLISSGTDVNFQETTNGTTALRVACQNGNIGLVRLLLSSGADVNLSHTKGPSALYIACQNGHLEVAQMLLSAGANVNESTSFSVIPLFGACQQGFIKVAQLLVSSGADVNSARTADAATALYMACANGHLEVVQLLLSSGAQINKPRDNGASPLFIACQTGHHNIAELLLASGANPNQCTTFSDMGTPLHAACLHSDLEMVQLLCDAGADINAVTPGTGTVPLYTSCSSGQLDIVQFLLAQETQWKCKNMINNISVLHAYCLSLCQLDVLSENKIHSFIQNFVALLSEYQSMCDISDHFTSVLDMLILARPSACALIDTIIANLGYFMAMEGKLDKPLYAILPETEATRSKIKESYSMHTTFSALVYLLDSKCLVILLMKMKFAHGLKTFLRMCKCLFHQNILHVIAQYKHRKDHESTDKAQLFLDHGVDVWAKDINGRLPLHIACMVGNTGLVECYWAAMWKTKHFMRDSGMNCEVIYCRQNYKYTKHDFVKFPYRFQDFFNRSPIICIDEMLDNVGMLPTDYYRPLPDVTKSADALPDSIQKIAHMFSEELILFQLQALKFDNLSNTDVEKFLYSPPRGKVQITGESKLIFSSVIKLVETICGFIGNLDPCFACKPVLSGSVYEGTKTTLPDELDLCLKLINFDDIARTDVEDYSGHLLAKCSPSTQSLLGSKYWRKGPEGRLIFASTMYSACFWQLFLKVMKLPAVSKYLNMSRITIDDFHRRSGFVGTLFITWYGEIYPCLPISVDLVPVVELGDYYCLIQPRYFDHETVEGLGNISMELSCNTKDKELISSLPVTLKDAYCLAKLIRGLSKSFISESGRVLTSDNVIQSYLLKTSLMWIVDPKNQFYKYYPGLDKDNILAVVEITAKCTPSTNHIHEVRVWTVKIFTMLKHILQSGHKIHTYNLPLNMEHNIVHVRDKHLAIALCDKCIDVAYWMNT